MRFFIVVLGLSTLAVAGPLPSLSKNALEARAQPLVRLIAPQTKKANACTSQTLNNQVPGVKARSSDSISVSPEIDMKEGADIKIFRHQLISHLVLMLSWR